MDNANPTIVVTRTDPGKADKLARHLRADGFHVLEAHDAQQMFECFRSYREKSARSPDLVISDSGLPDMTGLAAVEALKKDGTVLPFILITPTNDWRTFIAAEKMGAAYVFESSADDNPLRNAVFSLTRAW